MEFNPEDFNFTDTIFRTVKDLDADPFARIDKIPINDDQMSYKALGILTYLLSKPDGWDTRISHLIKVKTDKEKSLRSGIEELIQLRYLLRFKVMNSSGRIIKWHYRAYERPHKYVMDPNRSYINITLPDKPHSPNVNLDSKPDACFPLVDNPLVDNPLVDKDPPINNRFNKQTNLITKEDNNNKHARPVERAAGPVVVEIPKKLNKRFNKIKKLLLLMGWVGSMNEIITMFISDPEYVEGWVNKIYEADAGKIKSKPALLRASLRAGAEVVTTHNQERAALAALGLTEAEIKELL